MSLKTAVGKTQRKIHEKSKEIKTKIVKVVEEKNELLNNINRKGIAAEDLPLALEHPDEYLWKRWGHIWNFVEMDSPLTGANVVPIARFVQKIKNLANYASFSLFRLNAGRIMMFCLFNTWAICYAFIQMCANRSHHEWHIILVALGDLIILIHAITKVLWYMVKSGGPLLEPDEFMDFKYHLDDLTVEEWWTKWFSEHYASKWLDPNITSPTDVKREEWPKNILLRSVDYTWNYAMCVENVSDISSLQFIKYFCFSRTLRLHKKLVINVNSLVVCCCIIALCMFGAMSLYTKMMAIISTGGASHVYQIFVLLIQLSGVVNDRQLEMEAVLYHHFLGPGSKKPSKFFKLPPKSAYICAVISRILVNELKNRWEVMVVLWNIERDQIHELFFDNYVPEKTTEGEPAVAGFSQQEE